MNDRDVAAAALHRTAREDEAWLALYRDMGERVFRLAHRMTGSADLADDVTQDTFVRVYERLHQYSGSGSLSGWVFRIAVNLIRTRARSENRRSELLGLALPCSPGATADEVVVEDRMVLEEALGRLPEEQRTALLLHEVDGYTHGEIAEMMDIAEGSSKARVSRAKAALRKALDGRI